MLLEYAPKRALGLLLAGSLGFSALAAGCKSPDVIPTPTQSAEQFCEGLPAVERAEGGFEADCTVVLFDPKDLYNQRENPGGIKSDRLVEDIPQGQAFGVTCWDPYNKPGRIVIPTHNSQTGEAMSGAANLMPEAYESLKNEDIPLCDSSVFEQYQATTR